MNASGISSGAGRRWKRKEELDKVRKGAPQLAVAHLLAPDKGPKAEGPVADHLRGLSSRFVTGYGVFPTLTSEYSVRVLKEAIANYGRPGVMLSDHGSAFYAIPRIRCQREGAHRV